MEFVSSTINVSTAEVYFVKWKVEFRTIAIMSPIKTDCKKMPTMTTNMHIILPYPDVGTLSGYPVVLNIDITKPKQQTYISSLQTYPKSEIV